MKIGITTFQWSDNYGAVLQAHALQAFLLERGHTVEIIDFRPPESVSFLRRWTAKTPRGCVRKWESVWKKRLFEQFRRWHLIRTSEVFHSSSELRKISDRYDLLITGSDQVWNPRWLDQIQGFWDLYFLSFAGEQTRRVSYASSIGHSEVTTLTSEWQAKLSEKMKGMDAISVRELSSVSLIQYLCGRTDAVCVADPTLLLERSHYDQLADSRKHKQKYLFSYMLHGLQKDADLLCRQLSDRLDAPVVKCNARSTRLHRGYELPSVTGWLRMIRDAEFVVTNSFHATVFCLIFHVPFVVVLIEGKIGSMNSRITDLLEPMGLLPQIISLGDVLLEQLPSNLIDWNVVDQKIIELKAASISFLASHLS